MIKISCDSTADLSPELYERYNIAKLPLYINIAGREYMDGVDLTSEELFKLVSPSPLAWRPDFPGAPREAH